MSRKPQELKEIASKKVSKEQKISQESIQKQKKPGGGRLLKSESINFKDSFLYIIKETELINLLYIYIEDYIYKKINILELNEDGLVRFFKERQNELEQKMLQKIYYEKAINSRKSQLYELIHNFTNLLSQCKKEPAFDLPGDQDWNKYLTGTQRNIPTQMMMIILSKQHNQEQILAMILLHIYSISNEQVVQQLYQIIKLLYDDEITIKEQGIPEKKLIEILNQYFECLVERIKHNEINNIQIQTYNTNQSRVNKDVINELKRQFSNL